MIDYDPIITKLFFYKYIDIYILIIIITAPFLADNSVLAYLTDDSGVLISFQTGALAIATPAMGKIDTITPNGFTLSQFLDVFSVVIGANA